MKYTICLVSFPFNDQPFQKIRPILCLSDPIGNHEEIIAAYISSNTLENKLPSDIVISPNIPANQGSGLKVDSVIKLHKLMSLPKALMKRKLGEITCTQVLEVEKKLRKLIF